jgi:prepilin signal peptidase PulO-like enzyme (type II secretory pathway)
MSASVLILAVFLIGVRIMLTKVWRDKVESIDALSLVIAGGIGGILLILFGPGMTAIKGLLLCGILMYASLSDLEKREVLDSVSVTILILALVNFNTSDLPSMLIGAVMVFVPQMVIAITRPERSVGGADIKISTAVAFLLGAQSGLFALIVGLTLAVVTMLILSRTDKNQKEKGFPLVPFLAVGSMIAYMI